LGTVTTDVDRPEETVARLEAGDVTVRLFPTVDAVRVSVHIVNTAREVDELARALDTER
jgi:selenocysteine lyase/cysteine desulfurase